MSKCESPDAGSGSGSGSPTSINPVEASTTSAQQQLPNTPSSIPIATRVRARNPYRGADLRSKSNDDVWWAHRSGAIKAIMLFQFLLQHYMWDEDAPALTLSELVVMLHRHGKSWMDGINAKYLKHPVRHARPMDLVMQLLGARTWLYTPNEQNPAWPVPLMFVEPPRVPVFHIRPRDGSSAGLEAMAKWCPFVFDPTFVRPASIDIPTGAHVLVRSAPWCPPSDVTTQLEVMSLNTSEWHQELHTRRASTQQIMRLKAIGEDLWKLHNHDYGSPPPEHAPQPIIPSTKSSSSTTTSSTKQSNAVSRSCSVTVPCKLPTPTSSSHHYNGDAWD